MKSNSPLPPTLRLLFSRAMQACPLHPSCQILQALDQLRGPLLDSSQCLFCTEEQRSGQSTPYLSQQGCTEGKEHLLQPEGSTFLNAQDAIDLLCYEGELVGHVELHIHQYPGSVSAKLLSSWSAWVCTHAWGYSSHVQDFILLC